MRSREGSGGPPTYTTLQASRGVEEVHTRQEEPGGVGGEMGEGGGF